MICIAGKNNIAVECARYLLDDLGIGSTEMIACVTRSDSGKDGFQKSFYKFCREQGISIVKMHEILTEKDILFLSLQYDRIVPVAKMKSSELFNIHFSLLPAYRGMYTSILPILHGKNETGVTLHKLDDGIDTGDILAQKKIPIFSGDTARDLYLKYIQNGISLFKETIHFILSGSYQSIPQSAIGATYYSRNSLDFSDLKIDIKKTAWEVSNQIRAFSFKEFQVPKVDQYYVDSAEILPNLSTLKAGQIVCDADTYIDLATMDFDIRCHKFET